MSVLINGIRAGVVEGVLVVGLHILVQCTRLEVHHNHTIGIGSYPQIVMVVGTQSVDIALGEPVLMGVADKVSIVAHQSAIVAAHPDTSLSVLTEAGNDIS